MAFHVACPFTWSVTPVPKFIFLRFVHSFELFAASRRPRARELFNSAFTSVENEESALAWNYPRVWMS